MGNTKKVYEKEILKTTNPQYNELFDAVPEGIQIIDFNWRYRYVNYAILKQGKVTEKELLGHTMMEVYPDIVKTEMFNALQQSMKDRKHRHCENEFIYYDNSMAWFELTIEPIDEGILIIFIDISKLVIANKETVFKNDEKGERAKVLINEYKELASQKG